MFQLFIGRVVGPDSGGQISKSTNVGIVCSVGCSLLRTGSFSIYLECPTFFEFFSIIKFNNFWSSNTLIRCRMDTNANPSHCIKVLSGQKREGQRLETGIKSNSLDFVYSRQCFLRKGRSIEEKECS